MFLKEVYNYSKWLCAAMVLFAAAQLFIDYKHGVVMSPFFHYGMYSEKMMVQNEYDVWEVSVNDKLLQGQDFTPQQWDKIFLPIVFYNKLHSSNGMYNADIKRLFGKLHITVLEKDFLQTCSYNSFSKWYAGYLEKIIQLPVNKLALCSRKYNYGGSFLSPSASVTTLAQLCR